MKPKKKLNESVKVTFADGSIQIFESVKAASEAIGLSENSVKIRCSRNNLGSKSKDKITCQWADESTKRSKQAKRNRSKGNNFELEVINKLKTIGYSGCKSSRSQNKLADANKIDIVDTNNELPVNIQTKNTSNTPNYFAIRDACQDKTKPFIVLWKKSNTCAQNHTIAMIPIEYFYELIRKL